MGNGTSRRPRPVYKLAVTTTHTLADLNTLFIPREGSPPPPCLSARGTPSSSSYTWLMSRGHPRCPNFYRLSRCFHPFPPLEGLNDFNHPFFLPSLSFSLTLYPSPRSLPSRGEENTKRCTHKVTREIAIAQLALRAQPLKTRFRHLPGFAAIRSIRTRTRRGYIFG